MVYKIFSKQVCIGPGTSFEDSCALLSTTTTLADPVLFALLLQDAMTDFYAVHRACWLPMYFLLEST